MVSYPYLFRLFYSNDKENENENKNEKENLDNSFNISFIFLHEVSECPASLTSFSIFNILYISTCYFASIIIFM